MGNQTKAARKQREKMVWDALDEIQDPEIPVVSLVEMGIIREVSLCEYGATEEKLRGLGFTAVNIKTILSPPWSSDWITDSARAKLKAFGLAPLLRHSGNIEVTFFEPVQCPRCDSSNTIIKNSFGSTLCRAIYYCNKCQEPFEQFKAL